MAGGLADRGEAKHGSAIVAELELGATLVTRGR
jgi:hypothetical protein